MEHDSLLANGLSSKEAMERLVRIGRMTVQNWSCYTNFATYGCSVDKTLCRNLFFISLVSAGLLLVGAVTIENQTSYILLGLAAIHLGMLCVAHYVQYNLCKAPFEERKRKAREALDYVSKIPPSQVVYAPAGEPLSDDMLTQMALRDGNRVAVPKLLLVEGDVILLRPSQIVPCDCQLLTGELLKKGDRLLSKVEVDLQTGASAALSVTKALATSTPLVDHLFSVAAARRHFTTLDHQLHYCLHVVIERVLLPVVIAVSTIACLMRFLHDDHRSLFSSRFVFAIPSLIILPATAPMFFFVQLFAHQCDNNAVFNALRIPNEQCVKDLVTLFGNLTGTSFFDKHGLLSPAKPCLDKVVFFRPSNEDNSKDSISLEVMDLSSEQLPDFSWNVDFDDPNWCRFDSNLRVIGQCLHLNRCDEKFTSFLDHLSAVASTVPRTMATACRRCACVFPQLIGFKNNSSGQFFKFSNVLGLYQRRPGNAPLPGLTIKFDYEEDLSNSMTFSLTKHQTPLEMAFCTIHGDDHSLFYHLCCQGTANLVLEACSHVWDGEQLVPISERIIKTVADFYQRHSVTGYCLALSYRPVGSKLSDELSDKYFEVPLLRDCPRTGALARTHSIGSSQDDPLFDHAVLRTAEQVIQRWFTGHVLCGMIVSQYEAMPQAVQLIDQLETLCVRFVYFSRENELRSRVFAEKLGLEAGWNCHVSLAETTNDGDRRTLKDYFLSKIYRYMAKPSLDSIQKYQSRSDEEIHLKASTNYTWDSPSTRSCSQIPSKVALLPNKARLPTGIDAVRPHLEQVDNVPLLVGLITDCTPTSSLQMLKLMQEYGELVLSVGSSLSPVNTKIFLQADVSISVLPMGDWVCSANPEPNWQSIKEIVDRLMGIASDFRLSFEKLLILPKLIVACRHRCASLRGSLAFLLFASAMLSLSLLITTVFFLPLLLDFEQVFLTVFVQLPVLTLGSLFTAFHPKSNVIRISAKNTSNVPRQNVSWALVTFLIGFAPTSIFLVLYFFLMLIRNATVTCSFADVVCSVAAEHTSDAPLSTLAIRHIVGFHQAVYLCTLSSTWVFPLSSMWNDNPFKCLPWTASCIGCLVAQVLFSYLCGVLLHDVLSPLSLVILVVWTIQILVLKELIKLRSIQAFAREQRRTKLGFDTKLGMNSPY